MVSVKLDPILNVTVAVSYSPLIGLTGYLLDLDGYVFDIICSTTTAT